MRQHALLSLISIFISLPFVSLHVKAQSGRECTYENYYKESYKCLGVFGDCQKACSDKITGSYLDEVTPSDKYEACMKQSDCHGRSRACNDKAWEDYQACKDTGEQAQEVKQEPSSEEENTFLDKLSETPIFVGEWLDRISAAWAGLSIWDATIALGRQVFTDPEIALWEEEQRQKDEQAFKEYVQSHAPLTLDEMQQLINRPPTVEEISDYRSGSWGKDARYRLDYLRGEANIKYPGENEWKELKAGDSIPPGSRIFTGMDTTTVLTIKDKGVVQMLPFTEISVNEWGLERAAAGGQTTTDFSIKTGEIEVSVEGGVFTGSLQISTPQSVTSVRGTHFWISYDKNKNLSAVGVYEGEVEVTTGNSTYQISPVSDGPGIIVVGQKWSPVKLALAGGILLAIGGGLFMIVIRRHTPKGSGFKKK